MKQLIEIQRELVVTKNQYNAHGNYNYRSSEDILLALKPLLVKHDAVLLVTDRIHNMGVNCIYVEAIATLTIQDKVFTASSFARDELTRKGMSASQCTNSASSFAKKQALSNLFLIDDTTEVAPTAEEQEAHEKELKEQAEEAQKQLKLWLSKSNDIITKAGSIDELHGVFGALYREAKTKDVKLAKEITKTYQNRKKELTNATIQNSK